MTRKQDIALTIFWLICMFLLYIGYFIVAGVVFVIWPLTSLYIAFAINPIIGLTSLTIWYFLAFVLTQ